MKGYKSNIEEKTLANTYFRQVVYTSRYTQLVFMSLPPEEDIGEEVHGNDQFFRFESGKGKVVIDTTTYTVQDGDAVIVPAGATHNVINTSTTEDLKMYTLYSVPHHKDKTVHKTKKEAMSSEEEFDGTTTE